MIVIIICRGYKSLVSDGLLFKVVSQGSVYFEIGPYKKELKQEGFLRCQNPTSTVRLKVEGCRVTSGGCRIKSEEWRV